MKAAKHFLRPRDYADEILCLPTRESRLAALDAVPVEYRELVTRHVENAWALARSRRSGADVASRRWEGL